MARVFTKQLRGQHSLADAAMEHDLLGDTFVAQENLKIVGWEMTAYISTSMVGYPTHDGIVMNFCELTFAPKGNQDACVAVVAVLLNRSLFGSPASGAGWIDNAKSVVGMLAEGRYIKMAEGEHLNVIQDCYNASGMTLVFAVACTIYYEKG